MWLNTLTIPKMFNNILNPNVVKTIPLAPSPSHHRFYGWDSNHQRWGGKNDFVLTTLDLVEFTFWSFNIAIENGSLIADLPIKNGDFPVRKL